MKVPRQRAADPTRARDDAFQHVRKPVWRDLYSIFNTCFVTPVELLHDTEYTYSRWK